MIRFSAIVAVVAIALGLLVAGAVSGTLMLVYLAIGVASLALLLLIVGVVIWRDEVFGQPAGRVAGRGAGVEDVIVVPAAAPAAAAVAMAEVRPAQQQVSRKARSAEPAYSGAGRGLPSEPAGRDVPAAQN